MAMVVRQDVEKGPVTPTLPHARQDAHLPCFVLASFKPQRTALGQEPVLAGLGRAGEMVRLGHSLAAASLDGLFEHPASRADLIQVAGSDSSVC